MIQKYPALALSILLLVAPSALAQESAAQSPGRALVLSKCFQCHNEAMFRDQRQDRRSWEATIYRMVGRGGLWTPQEIRLMADYLGTELGTNARSAPTPPTPSATPAPSATPSR